MTAARLHFSRCLLFIFFFGGQGFVATLKENFGFLETTEHDKEVFFHYRFVPKLFYLPVRVHNC